MLKRLLPLLLLLCTAPGFAAGPDVLTPYTATYGVMTYGIRAGEAHFKLEKLADDRYRFSSKSRTTGLVSLFRHDKIAEASVFTVADDGALKAQEYHYLQTGGDERKQVIAFDWQKNVAHSIYRGDSKTLPVPPGASDPFLAQLKLSRRVARGMESGNFAVVNRNELDTYHLQVKGRDKVTVSGGTFDTVRVERSEPGSSRQTIFWLAPKLHYIPVKVEQLKDGDSVFRLVLERAKFASD